jgi:SSS family solute:Na+ symporter
MKTLDWVVLFSWLVSIVCYGLWRGRGSGTVDKYLLAGKTMPWYAMGLSIMATQASAITFISTTGQSYVDGMRFVQFYFGLPLAMVILSATAVPLFHRANVYTAYEYLEKRFDAKTRALVSLVFLMQRGLAAGISLYAPAVVLSVVLGWPDRITTWLMGGLVLIFTSFGGIKAVTWADVQQMIVIIAALMIALGVAVFLLPHDVSFADALTVAGAAGRLNPVTVKFNWDDRYNLFSGLIGGMFLALAYFGTDQSQVQRYLTGKSIGQSRLSLIFNAMAKIPMQFFILFIGAMVFVFFTFEKAPVLFQPVAMRAIGSTTQFAGIEKKYSAAFEDRRSAATDLIAAKRSGDTARWKTGLERYRSAQRDLDGARQQAGRLAENVLKTPGFNDTNYIFLSFITHYMPVGLVGLVVGVIFSAAMSSISGEINSLATVSVIDVYRRYARREASDRHYLMASKIATLFWGLYAVSFASYGSGWGALIEAVNMIGSLFYGGMLGVFVLAVYFRRVSANGAFFGMLAGEAAIFATKLFTGISFLWYNVIGCFVVILTGLLISVFERGDGREGVEHGGSQTG